MSNSNNEYNSEENAEIQKKMETLKHIINNERRRR